jgi:DNA-binding transcriptional LysR family regulator
MATNDLMDHLPRHLKMRELRVFLSVMEHGSFRKAASALHVTQPAVTKAIADLENLLGFKLFDRNAVGAEATIYGQSFARFAGAIFGEMKCAADELETISSGSKGTLRIGTVPMPASGILPVAIQHLINEHPGIFVSVIEASEDVLADALHRRELDIVLSRLSLFRKTDEFHLEPLFEDSLCVLAAKDHPLAKQMMLTWDDLLNKPWVMPPDQSLFKKHIQHVLNLAGFEAPKESVKSASIHIMYGMVIHAGMMTFAAKSQFDFSPMKEVLVKLPIDLPEISESIGAVSLRDRTLHPLANLLIYKIRRLTSSASLRE